MNHLFQQSNFSEPGFAKTVPCTLRGRTGYTQSKGILSYGRQIGIGLILAILWLNTANCQQRVLFIRGGTGTVGFFEGGSDEQGASIYNFIDDRNNHGWGELSSVLESEGFELEEIQENSEVGVGKTPVPLETMALQDYAIIVFGSNNAQYSAAQVNAVTNYVANGGSILCISDANFGSNWSDAASSDQQFLNPFGLVMNQDQGTYGLERNSGDFLVAAHPVFSLVNQFDGEGVSPGSIDTSILSNLPAGVNAAAGITRTILSRVKSGQSVRRNPLPLFSGNQGGSTSQTANDGTLVVATSSVSGAGRVAIHFDRNTFFNLAGAGTNINNHNNERYARNLFHWLAGTTPATNPPPRSHIQGLDGGLSASPGDSVTFTAVARDLNGTVVSAELLLNGSSKGIDTTIPYQWTVNDLIPGSNTLVVRTTDNEGAVTDNTRTIEIADPGDFVNPLNRSGWQLSSSHNNNQAGADNLLNAIDGSDSTRWATRTAQIPAMVFEINFTRTESFKAIRLDATDNPDDYPRGYIVSGSNDGISFTTLAGGAGSQAAVDIVLPELVSYQYLRIEQTGTSGFNWWSIGEINLYNPDDVSPPLTNLIPLDRSGWSLSSSVNNSQTGPTNLPEAIDGNPATRWATRTPQAAGQTLRVDFGDSYLFSEIVLETNGNPNDYPRGYTVRGSRDGANYTNLITETNNTNAPVTMIQLNHAVNYRSIEIEQINNPGVGNWWSIHEMNVNAPNPNQPLSIPGWREQHFSEWLDDPGNESLIFGDDADPDFDGIPNLHEYAFNTDPNTRNQNPVSQVAVSPGVFDVTFPRWTTPVGISYLLETSENLATWDQTGTLVSGPTSLVDNKDGTETVTWQVTFPVADDEQGFVRVRIGRN